MSWAFPGAAISRFTRSQTEHNAGVLFDRRSARARMPRRDETRRNKTRQDETRSLGGLYRVIGSRISRAAPPRLFPAKQRTSYFPLIEARQRRSTPRACDILTCARLRDRGSSRSWSRQVYTHAVRIFIIDTIADSLWYFNDTPPRVES